MSDLALKQSLSLTPQSLDEAMRFADILATSTIVPKEFRSNLGNILVAIQWGLELGMRPMQACKTLQSSMVALLSGVTQLWLSVFLSYPVLRNRWDEAREKVATKAVAEGDTTLSARIR